MVLQPDPWENGDTLAEVDKDTGRVVVGCNLGALHRIRYRARRMFRDLASPHTESTDWAPFPDTVATHDE